MLELRGVHRSVEGETWLRDIDLVLADGLHVLAGPSLAGKTTLMRLAAGLDRPDRGTIVLDGADVTDVPVRRRDVAFVYQDFINYPAMTVRDNIASPLRRSGGHTTEETADRVTELATLLNLTPYLDRRPAELSGGQQQRVAIARALAKRSRLLILDEPLANLDYKLREELREELEAIFAQPGRIVLYSTSEPQEALGFGANTVVLHQGEALQSGPALSIYQRPATSVVARVFSDPPMNLLPARIGDDGLEFAGQVSAARPENFSDLGRVAITLGIRPHHLGLERQRDSDIAVPGTVALSELTGSETFVHLDAGRGDDAVGLVAESPGVHPHRLGAELTVYARSDALYAFDPDDGALLAAPTAAVAPIPAVAGDG